MTTCTVIAHDVATAEGLIGCIEPGSSVEVMLLDGDAATAEAAGALPADSVVQVRGVAPHSEAAAVGAALVEHVAGSDVVVLGSTQWSRDLAGWLAIVLDAPVVWAIDTVRVTDSHVDADQIVLGGTHRMVHRVEAGGPTIVLARPAVAASEQSRPAASATLRSIDFVPGSSSIRLLDAETASAETGIPLAGARLVVSVGRGIGGPQHLPVFAALAERLGAALGASRVVVDAGWLPFSHQVGQTGSSVSPDLYLAFGISGAIQHLAGMRSSRCIVAVNTDVAAPLCRQADLVVECDAVEFATALLERLSGRSEVLT